MSSLTQEIIGGQGWLAERRPCGALLVYVDPAAEGDPILDALTAVAGDDLCGWCATAMPDDSWLLRPEP